MNPIKAINQYVENHPYGYYTLIICVLLAFNLFLRLRSGDDWLDTLLLSVVYTAILSAGLIYGDRQRRKNLANKKKIEELLNNKENNGL